MEWNRLHLLPVFGRFVYVAFIVDVYAQLIVGWHAATRKTVDLVEVRLRMAIWERNRTH